MKRTWVVLFKIFLLFSIFVSANLISAQSDYELVPFKLKKKPPRKRKESAIEELRVVNKRKDIPLRETEKSWTAGIKGLANLSILESDSIGDKKFDFHGLVGLYGEYRIIPYLGIELDIFYQRKGTESSGPDVNIDYISLIPYLKVYPFKEYFFIGFGPSLHFRINDDVIGTIPGGGTLTYPFSNPFAVGLNMGVGLFFEVDLVKLSFECRFDLGLSQMFKSGNTPNNSKAYFRDLQFIIGLGFNF